MKTSGSLTLFTTICTGLLLLCGCSSMNTVERAQPVGTRQMVSDKRIINDSSLDVKAKVVGVNEAITAGGFLRVQIELINMYHSSQRIGYKFEWFDENGMQINTAANGSWFFIQLEGRESRFISGIAPTDNCKDFRLKLIKP